MPPAARRGPVPMPVPEDQVAGSIHHHAASMDGVAAAMREIAEAIRAATDQRQPMDVFFEGATNRLELLCRWLRRKGPWLLASIPPALVAIQAISPQAAKALAALLQGLNG